MEPMEPQDEAEQLILRRKGLTTLPIELCQNLKALRVLSASHNALVDIKPVAHLPALEELNVNHNQLTDLSPVVQCQSLRILLASNNHISEIDGLEELPSLCRLSLFQNMLPDLDALLDRLQAFQQLQSLDLGGNPCFHDAGHRHVIVKGLPNLIDLDGEVVAGVDRQLAAEFFLCAEEFGFERPASSYGLRPKTAPVKAVSMTEPTAAGPGFNVPDRSSRSQSRPRSSRKGSRSTSRARSNSPDPLGDNEIPVITDDVQASIERFKHYVQTLQLRLRTTKVDCENLTRQIQQLRQETQEPTLGTASLRQKLERLEEDNRTMHALAEENRKMRLDVEEKEAELSQQRQTLGLPQLRPSTGRPGTAPVEAVLAISEPSSLEAFTSKCRVLRRELEIERERTLQLRAKAYSQILGREVSPPRKEF